AVVAAHHIVGLRSEFQARYVLQPQIRPVWIRADDDVAEFLGGNQAALSADRISELLPGRNWLSSNFSRRVDRVLNLNRLNDLRNRDLKFRQLIRLHPDGHRVLTGAKHQNFRDSWHAR